MVSGHWVGTRHLDWAELSTDRLLFLAWGGCFLVEQFVFCSYEVHERDEILRTLQGKGCPGFPVYLVSQPPVQGLILDYFRSCFLICMECGVDLLSSRVDLEELAFLVVEDWCGFSAVLFIFDLHRDSFHLAHPSPEHLEEGPGLGLDSVCDEREVGRFHPGHLRSRALTLV